MKCKIVIFVVFASFAQSSFALSTTAPYGLSEEGSAGLSNITINENTTLLAIFEAINPLFDVLKKFAAQSIFNLSAGTEDASAVTAEGLSRAKDAANYSLNAIPIALGKSCCPVDTVRAALHGILDHIYVLMPNAIVLAQSADYFRNEAEIKVLQAAVQTDYANFVKKLYDPIRICLNTTDAATLAVIKSAQDKSGDAFANVVNAVFDAIKIYGAAISAEHQDLDLLIDIERFRGQALIDSRSAVENQFSALKAIFVSYHLNQTGIVSSWAANQYARTVTINKIQGTVGIIYDSIIDGLMRITLGLSPDRDDDFSRNDASRAEVAARFNAMDSHVLESFRSVQTVASSAIVDAEEKLSSIIDTLVTKYYDAIDLAIDKGTNNSETLDGIEVHLRHVLSHADYYVSFIFNVIGSDQSWDVDTAAKIATLQGTAKDGVEIFMNSIFNAINILAKASHEIETPSEDYLSAILANKSKAISAIVNFADSISFAHITVLIAANNKNEARIELESPQAPSA